MRPGSPFRPEGACRFRFLSGSSHKVLALIPLVYVVWVVVKLGVDVPFWDQWELVPLLEKTYRADLTAHDLWAQHNEHRPMFPTIIMLALARITGWNIRAELGVNLALALGFFAVIARQIQLTARRLGLAGLRWAIPASAVAVFSISQYENWLWGWQIMIWLNVLAVVGGIVILANGQFSWPKLGGSALLGIVATYSFANGILFWPIGLLILLIVRTGRKRKKAALTVWLLVSGITLAAYFWRYQKPPDDPPWTLIFRMPLQYAAYVLKYIGSICACFSRADLTVDNDLAAGFGLAAMLCVCATGWFLARRKSVRFDDLLPYVGMVAYGLGSALMTGTGRIQYGSLQALSPRYCTIAVPFWVSLLVLLRLVTDERQTADAALPPRRQSPESVWLDHRGAARWVFLGAICILAMSSYFATGRAEWLSQRLANGRRCLLELTSKPAAEVDPLRLAKLYPQPAVILERYPILVKHHLSAFRKNTGR